MLHFRTTTSPRVTSGEGEPTASTPTHSSAPGMPGTHRRVTYGSNEGLRNEKKDADQRRGRGREPCRDRGGWHTRRVYHRNLEQGANQREYLQRCGRQSRAEFTSGLCGLRR